MEYCSLTSGNLKESHIADIHFLTTLEGYIHWKLTGLKVLGIGEASGMFPIDATTKDYHAGMLEKFDHLVAGENLPWTVKNILPQVLLAGDDAGTLTQDGAKLLDPSGTLQAGIPLCPPEGDAGTEMVATNSVAVRTVTSRSLISIQLLTFTEISRMIRPIVKARI